MKTSGVVKVGEECGESAENVMNSGVLRGMCGEKENVMEAGARAFQPGDIVTHVSDGFWPDTCVIERVDTATFPDDPVAFFTDGGFWRTSRLKLAASPAPKEIA